MSPDGQLDVMSQAKSGWCRPVLLLAVVTALLASACGSEASSTVSRYPDERLRKIAMRMAKGTGDAHPTSIRVVRTQYLKANDLITGDMVNEPDREVWVVEIRGDFVCEACSTPSGEQAPTGTVAYSIVYVHGDGGGSFSMLGSKPLALESLGRVEDLT